MLGLVGAERVLFQIEHAQSDVGAVVGRALEVRQEVRPHKAGLNAALTLFHAQDMPRAQLILQIVHDLLKRLDAGSRLSVVFGKRLDRKIHDLADGSRHDRQLVLCAA